MPDAVLIRQALSCLCPRCTRSKIYKGGFFSLALHDKCPSCGLPLAENDSGDGPVVFMIFVLGFLLVPLALVLEYFAHPPLWLHVVLWGGVATFMTLGGLRPLKAYVIALEYRHRPGTWEDR